MSLYREHYLSADRLNINYVLDRYRRQHETAIPTWRRGSHLTVAEFERALLDPLVEPLLIRRSGTQEIIGLYLFATHNALPHYGPTSLLARDKTGESTLSRQHQTALISGNYNHLPRISDITPFKPNKVKDSLKERVAPPIRVPTLPGQSNITSPDAPDYRYFLGHWLDQQITEKEAQQVYSQILDYAKRYRVIYSYTLDSNLGANIEAFGHPSGLLVKQSRILVTQDHSQLKDLRPTPHEYSKITDQTGSLLLKQALPDQYESQSARADLERSLREIERASFATDSKTLIIDHDNVLAEQVWDKQTYHRLIELWQAHPDQIELYLFYPRSKTPTEIKSKEPIGFFIQITSAGLRNPHIASQLCNRDPHSIPPHALYVANFAIKPENRGKLSLQDYAILVNFVTNHHLNLPDYPESQLTIIADTVANKGALFQIYTNFRYEQVQTFCIAASTPEENIFLF